MKKKIGKIVLLLIAAIGIIGIGFVSPIPQDQSYHNFADSRIIIGIPNFWNVLSNVPYLLVGLFGLYRTNQISGSKNQYIIFFIGVLLVCFGSGYYHFMPNDQTLLWDRLPMTIAFMALFSAIISEYLNKSLGQGLLYPFLIIGLFSVIYWIQFNDLRIYALVQFYPLLAIPIILILFKTNHSREKGFWALILAYMIAKVFEHYDQEINATLGMISGHSLKHLCSALGVYVFIELHLKHFNQKIGEDATE